MTTNGTAAGLNSKPIIIITVIIAVMCLCLCTIASIIGIIYFNRDTSPTSTPNAPITEDLPDTGPTSTPTAPITEDLPDTDPTSTPTAPITQDLPESNPQTQTWLVMFYFDADDVILEEAVYFDLNEVEMIGSTDRVKMVAQIDRSEGAFTGDGDWTSARRYYLTQDDDLNTINSQLIADLGEVDMGNSNTLVDFATWAIQSYPADKVVLIMSDHGSGWPGGWTDVSPLDSSGNWIYLTDLEGALGQIIADTGIRQFELVGMDACLMSMLEVYNGLAPYAHYAVASEDSEPSIGWAYASFLGDLAAQPEMSGADLGRAIVESYIIEDQGILNDEARERTLSYYGTSAGEVTQEMNKTITIAAVDLSALQPLNTAMDNFLYALKNVDQTKVAEARSYAQAFYNVFDETYPSPYIDLSNFADFVVTTTGDQAVSQSTQQLQTALSGAVIAEKHGDQRPGATGISVYFPVSELYWNEELGYAYYTEATRSSASQNLWDDFLAYHYAGQEFGLGNPSREARLPAPGAAQISIAPLTFSANSIQSGDILNIQTEITGDKVAYIYLFGLVKNNRDNRYLLYFIDYLQADERSQEQNGVAYPVWERSNGKIHLSIDWDLSADAVCDDTNCVLALVNPDKYTPQPENRLYYVEGWYVYSETGNRIEATMYFYNEGDNLIRNIIANPVGNDSIVNPSAVIPKPGDQFLTMNTELTFDDSGIFHSTFHEGYSLTFGDQPFYYGNSGDPSPAEYVVGIMVKDMDGNITRQSATVTVK
jgi:hypothetical protein